MFLVGMVCFPPPGTEQVFEADLDADDDDGGHGAHCLAHPVVETFLGRMDSSLKSSTRKPEHGLGRVAGDVNCWACMSHSTMTSVVA